MSSSFEDRKRAAEAKFIQDQDLAFKARARRNKKLGLWAAEQLGLTGDDAQEYAKTVITSDFEEPGDEDVFRKIRADFDEKKVELSDHQIRRTMEELLVEAVEELHKG